MQSITLKNSTNGLHKNSASGGYEAWREVCRKAASDDEAFNKFRNNDIVKLIIDGYPPHAAWEYLISIRNKPYFREIIRRWHESDSICSPQTKIKFTLKNKDFSLSPATGRYIRNVYNLIEIFGKDILQGVICEIGAGFGGDCKIFKDFLNIYSDKAQQRHKYYIFDLPSAVGLIRRYLKSFNYSAKFMDVFNERSLPQHYDLIISNAAFSEMRGKLLDQYFDKIISKADKGYFITNFESHSAPDGGWTTEEFIGNLRAIGKINPIAINSTEWFLSPFDSQSSSKLVIFGSQKLPKATTQNIQALLWYSLVRRIMKKVELSQRVIKRLLFVDLKS